MTKKEERAILKEIQKCLKKYSILKSYRNQDHGYQRLCVECRGGAIPSECFIQNGYIQIDNAENAIEIDLCDPNAFQKAADAIRDEIIKEIDTVIRSNLKENKKLMKWKKGLRV